MRALLAVLACLSAQVLLSDTPERKKISTFAPAEDLLEQADFFIARMAQSLADPADFAGANQSRTWKDAHTLAALALMLSAHDEAVPFQGAMPALLRGAQALAIAEENVAEAQKALEQIKAARSGQTAGGEAVKWEKVASLPALMKQVPLVHAGLRRNVAPNRLERTAKQSAGMAATLAAIAQAALLDDEYVKSPEDQAAWRAFCAQMRDASGEVNSAVHARDQARVDAGMKRMLESCDACHARFRQR